MVIINRHADYSENRIGKITFLTDEIKSIGSKFYPNASNDKLYILQKFIDDIGGTNGSIYKKIQFMAFPFMASTINESVLNIFNNSCKLNVESNPSEAFSFSDGKLKNQASYMTTINIESTNALDVCQFGLFLPDVSELKRCFNVGNGYININNVKTVSGQSLCLGTQATMIYPNYDNTNIEKTYVIGCEKTSGTSYNNIILFNDTYNEISINANDETPVNLDKVYFSGTNPTNICTGYEYSVIGYAKSLTKQEMYDLNKALINLRDGLN